MKLPKLNLLIICFLFLGILVNSGCKKHRDKVEPGTEDPEDPDNENNMDFLSQDVEIFFSSGKFNPSDNGFFCGLSTIDSTTKSIWKISFNGTSCNSKKKREGMIIISIEKGTRWEDKGAIMSVQFINYKVTDLSTNRTVEMVGTQKIMNETGGSIVNMIDNKLVHVIRTIGLKYFFDGKPKTINEAKRRTFYKVGIDYHIENSGDTIIKGYPYPDVAEWGTTVKLIPYQVSYLEPLIANTCGGKTKFISGKKFHKSSSSGTTTIYGVTRDGDLDHTCDAWGYKVTWIDKSDVTNKRIYKY
ncbi:MAG: hypothetical protein J7604_03625 [Sporocytophaga sp.]|uniref:hypothetical protein n=1 Tax=Sporocytophaga sp. TaxID=2231183 RepID=UPI001B03294A|nr:hypothetical protein [Sporocytophaga sp.]MBO9699271.1 hypothetical protein [Sporocytophaga sp.]